MAAAAAAGPANAGIGLLAAVAGETEGLGGKPTLPRWPAGDGPAGEGRAAPASSAPVCKAGGRRRGWDAASPAGERRRLCMGNSSSNSSDVSEAQLRRSFATEGLGAEVGAAPPATSLLEGAGLPLASRGPVAARAVALLMRAASC